MRKTLALLLLAGMLLTPALWGAAGEEAASEADTMTEALTRPQNIWMLTGDGEWRLMIQETVSLGAAQREAAARRGILVLDGYLPKGTALTPEDLAELCPGWEAYVELPAAVPTQEPAETEPSLAMFELTGEWYYGEGDVLYYQHDEASRPMTVDEVFAALPRPGGGKTVYLTIDDAPSLYTMELLAVLDALGVKATFFVVGAYVKNRPVFLRAIHDQGHAIANHSYTHDAKTLSSSFAACLRDFQRCERAVEEALGFALAMPILRIPYGASTIPVSYRTQLQERGYLWIDWNALNGDTEDDIDSDEEALQRAFSTASRYEGDIVILVHDGKRRTIRTLPELVRHFREQGYEFRVLDPNMEKIPGVRMGLPVR